jgi:hypothetical protein
VVARVLIGGLLLWLALRWRPRGLAVGYAALVAAAVAIHMTDLGLWLVARLG